MRWHIVQLLKVDERSNGRWNGSQELVGVQVADGGDERRVRDLRRMAGQDEETVAVVQIFEIGERSNGRWNGSRELIAFHLAITNRLSR